MPTRSVMARPFLDCAGEVAVFSGDNMPTEEKVRTVDDIADKLRRAVSLVVTDYRGLTVDQLQDLRRRLHAANVDYVVVKNTLARRAADDSGLVALKEDLDGPVALAIGYDDPLMSARLG